MSDGNQLRRIETGTLEGGRGDDSYGLCRCGCGQKTRIAEESNKSKGHIKGQPKNYLLYHQNRGKIHGKGSRPKIALALRGRSLSEEHKRNISMSIKGPRSCKWRGGRTRLKGYVRVMAHEHPHADGDGYVLEHRLVMEGIIGRYLEPREIVHHKNLIRDDNEPENLQLCANDAEHRRVHMELKKRGGGLENHNDTESANPNDAQGTEREWKD